MKIDRILINNIRNQSRDIRNPSTVRTTLYSITCVKCNGKFMLSMNNDENIEDRDCKSCGRKLTNNIHYSVNRPPYVLSVIESRLVKKSGHDNLGINDIVSANSYSFPLLYGPKTELESEVMFKDDMKVMFDGIDHISRELLRLVCFEDYSIKKAARILGISHNAADTKLKRLKNKKSVQDVMRNRYAKIKTS